MRDIVEEAQSGPYFAHEVENVQRGRALVEAVAVASHIETEQAADQQSVRTFVRYDQDTTMAMCLDDAPDNRQGSVQDIQTWLPAVRSNGEGIFLPDAIFFLEVAFDFGAPQAFPAPVVDSLSCGSAIGSSRWGAARIRAVSTVRIRGLV